MLVQPLGDKSQNLVWLGAHVLKYCTELFWIVDQMEREQDTVLASTDR